MTLKLPVITIRSLVTKVKGSQDAIQTHGDSNINPTTQMYTPPPESPKAGTVTKQFTDFRTYSGAAELVCWSGEGWGCPWTRPAAKGSGVDPPAPASSAPAAALGSAAVPPAGWCWGCRYPRGPSAGRGTAPRGSWWDLGGSQGAQVIARYQTQHRTVNSNAKLKGPH